MKLSINLAVREEIAAAIPLLKMIYDAGEDDLSGTQAAGLQAAPLPPAVVAPSIAAAAPLPIAPVDTPAAIFGATIPAPVPPAPTPASTVSAPMVPVHTAPPASTAELDTKGLPWDERIHSSGKSLLKDGTWRYKGGIPPERIAAVEAELRGASIATAAQTPDVAPDPDTFEQLMPRITAAVVGGVIPSLALGEACTAQGLPSIVALQQNPQFVPLVWAHLKQQFPALS